MNELSIQKLEAYTEDDARQIGHLMTFLTKRYDGRPFDKELLEAIIESPHQDQLVARLQDRIVGAATLGIVMGPVAGKVGHLNDFVTDPEVRGRGIGARLWAEIENWCTQHDVPLEFTSHESRQAAHDFYVKHGAKPRDTTVFRAFDS